jgi:hypothetical protein
VSLKSKIEWMLEGNFLTDKNDPQFAYGINLKTMKFFSINKWDVKDKKPKIVVSDVMLPLEDISKNMVIFKV